MDIMNTRQWNFLVWPFAQFALQFFAGGSLGLGNGDIGLQHFKIGITDGGYFANELTSNQYAQLN